jgi:hypothetical protein
MESPPHLDFLRSGAKVWNEWRQRNPTPTPYVVEADLRDADLE